jgi:hypothetical protein
MYLDNGLMEKDLNKPNRLNAKSGRSEEFLAVLSAPRRAQ